MGDDGDELRDELAREMRNGFTSLVASQARLEAKVDAMAPAIEQTWKNKQDIDQAKGAVRFAKWAIGVLGVADLGLIVAAFVQAAGG